MEEEAAEIRQLYELHYSDLLILSSPDISSPPPSPSEIERRYSTTKRVMEALGPNGPGLLSITGVPNSPALRRALLPLSRKLALLRPEDRNRILKIHNLGSDVPLKNPERNVSSFAMQLKYSQSTHQLNSEQYHIEACPISNNTLDHEFKHLGTTFQELGFLMMELGLCISRICDKEIGGHEVELSLLDSCSAKGRLIHYHSALDYSVLKQGNMARKCTRNIERLSESNGRSCQNGSDLWQQWHYDYGIFTVLTCPLFLSCKDQSFAEECSAPCEHTYLQIFDPGKNSVFTVNAHPESFIIQVGESADIISKGKLKSTLHSVCGPGKRFGLSREMFVVFLQPAWGKTFSLSDYPVEKLRIGDNRDKEENGEGKKVIVVDGKISGSEIGKIVPSLVSRLKDGMTFAEFARETTKQYYSGKGLQSNR